MEFKIDKNRVAYEAPEFYALSMRGKHLGYTAIISKKLCTGDGKAQLRGAITLKPFEDRTRPEIEIPVDEFIREAM